MVCKGPLTLSLSREGRGDALPTGTASPLPSRERAGVRGLLPHAKRAYRKAAGIMSATMARNTMAPKWWLLRNRCRQLSGSSISSVATCQTRCAAAAASPQIEPEPGAYGPSREGQSADGDPEKQAEPSGGAAPEAQRGGLQASKHVVLLVLVRIDCVVADCPGDGSGVKHDRRKRQVSPIGGPAHQGAIGECQAQHRLRPERNPLHQGIDQHDADRAEAQGDCKRIELKENREPHETERQGAGDCRAKRDLPARERTPLGPCYFCIDIAVDDIVINAARAAHDECAGHEKKEQPDIGPEV